MTTAPIEVRVERLRRSFGRRVALDGVSLRVRGPVVLGVVGANGSGKTTFLRTLVGLLQPTEGRVTIDALAPRRAFRPNGLALGYMPQAEGLYLDLTARENVAFAAKIQGVPRGARSSMVESALAFAGVAERADDKAATLSGGLRRRVSLACALVHRPRFLVLDEPTAGVDPELRLEMWKGFRALRDEGAFVVVSTHYLGEAQRCDAVLLLREGRVLALEPPADLLERTGATDLEDAFLRLVQGGAP